ncbi:hypothetical protein JS528_06860 [Bifidobacterium sp. MA2]|uniref:Tetrapyrrole biosynthesis uroporphyrinogen III synthase domain-containing protein n=1 Tax=Bifidobacterium santillanense TaxID=2809028 RepID=A0ABS5UQF8_9BIFI|nr:hypothetical protein [Bifidobacterium santillanense]MBT1173074.1 hypothetical protein [Bifidobacterium santillanense]
MTSVLFTIEGTRVDAGTRRALVEAGVAPIYCPLRELRAVEPDADGLRAMLAADTVIVTSGFALQVYLAHPRWRTESRNPNSPTLIVLSARMARTARAAGIRNVLVPDEESQRGVAALLRRMQGVTSIDESSRAGTAAPISMTDDSPRIPKVIAPIVAPLVGRCAVHLCGSLSVPHDALPPGVARVQVYENHWDTTCEDRACGFITESIAGRGGSDDMAGMAFPDIYGLPTDRTGCSKETATDPHRIGRILVTSPSAYRRLRAIMKRIPECFTAQPTYYTLGPSTTAVVEADGNVAKSPGTRTDVLHAAIRRLVDDVTAD